LVVGQLKLVNDAASVVCRALHGNHPSSLLTGQILYHNLIHLGFDITWHQPVKDRTGIRLVDVIPLVTDFFIIAFRQRQQLQRLGALGHGVDEFVADQEQAVDLAFHERIQHHLDATDQLICTGVVAQVRHGCHHVSAIVAEEGGTLLANSADIGLNTLLFPFTHFSDEQLERVSVQTTTKTAIRGDHNVAYPLDLALLHERMAVILVGLRNVSDYLTHLFSVRAGCLHTLLSLTHLARGYHFHGRRDLLRALDASDLVTYFFSDGHMSLPFQVRHSNGPAGPHNGGPFGFTSSEWS